MNLNYFLRNNNNKKRQSRYIQVFLQQKVIFSLLCPTENSVAAAIKTHCTGLTSNIPVVHLIPPYVTARLSSLEAKTWQDIFYLCLFHLVMNIQIINRVFNVAFRLERYTEFCKNDSVCLPTCSTQNHTEC